MSLIVKIKKNLGSFKLDVDFKIEDNDITSILGASGSGKTMTLKCIAGIVKPDEGYIKLNDRVLYDSSKHINLPPQKRKVGYMFQNYALFPNMSVKQNIMVSMKNIPNFLGFVKESKYKDIIKLLELEGLENRKPCELSGGQMQRVALARILVNDPDIILLDEPFSALDEHLRTKLQIDMKNILTSLNKETLLVTHNRDEAYLMSKNMILMDGGKDIICKSTKDVFNDPTYLRVSIITGCKNNVACIKEDDYTINVPSWNMRITSNRLVPNDIKYIGIRAHNFTINGNNLHKVEIVERIEEPFEILYRFRFIGQEKGAPLLYYRVAKKEDLNNPKNIEYLGFNDCDVLFLK